MNANNKVIGQLWSYLRLVSRIGETKYCYYKVCPVAEYQIESKYSNQTWKERRDFRLRTRDQVDYETVITEKLIDPLHASFLLDLL